MSVMNNIVSDFQKQIHTFTESIVRDLSKKYGFDYEEALRYLTDEPEVLSREDLPVVETVNNTHVVNAATTTTNTTTTTTTTVTPDAVATIMSDSNSDSDVLDSEDQSSSSSSSSGEEAGDSEEDAEIQEYPKTSYPLPYTGVLYNSCHGIRLQHNMFVQCSSKPMKNASHNLCKTCFKQSQSNEHGKPNCGLIEDRLKVAHDEYKDPRGKKPKPYVEVLKSLKLEIEDVRTEFQEKGIKIPEFVWEEKKEKKEKKGKKEKKEKKEEKPVEVVSSSDEESDQNLNSEEVLVDTEVLEVQYNGVKYFQCDDKILYDIETRERIGIYSEEKNGVVFD